MYRKQDISLDGYTEMFYELMNRLHSVEGLVRTLNKLDILTNDEMRVIYTKEHVKVIEKMRFA